jgi:hypothetical protein
MNCGVPGAKHIHDHQIRYCGWRAAKEAQCVMFGFGTDAGSGNSSVNGSRLAAATAGLRVR